MDTPKPVDAKTNLKEAQVAVAHELVSMFREIRHLTQLPDDERVLLDTALQGVKFELFPRDAQSDEGKRRLAQLITSYQVRRYIINRIDEWLRTKTETPIETIQELIMILKGYYDIKDI